MTPEQIDNGQISWAHYQLRDIYKTLAVYSPKDIDLKKLEIQYSFTERIIETIGDSDVKDNLRKCLNPLEKSIEKIREVQQ